MTLWPLFFVLAVGASSPWVDYVGGNCERCPECCVNLCESAAEIEFGEVAPCDGILLPEAWALELVELRDVALPRCQAEAERGARVAAASLERCNQERRALAEALRDTDQMLEAVGPPAPPQWYKSPALWFSVGLVVGAVTVGAASR